MRASCQLIVTQHTCNQVSLFLKIVSVGFTIERVSPLFLPQLLTQQLHPICLSYTECFLIRWRTFAKSSLRFSDLTFLTSVDLLNITFLLREGTIKNVCSQIHKLVNIMKAESSISTLWKWLPHSENVTEQTAADHYIFLRGQLILHGASQGRCKYVIDNDTFTVN